MKRRDLLRHLTLLGCRLLREGGSHSWWHHTITERRSAIPRHAEISNHLAAKFAAILELLNQSGFNWSFHRTAYGVR